MLRSRVRAIGFVVLLAPLPLSGCITVEERGNDAEIARLRAENRSLRAQLDAATGEQMRELAAAAVRYAGTREDGRLPDRPSDLREVLGEHNWELLLAPYDRTPERLAAAREAEDPWSWLDEHASFDFLGGPSTYLVDQPMLVERRAEPGGTRWVFFADAHGERREVE